MSSQALCDACLLRACKTCLLPCHSSRYHVNDVRDPERSLTSTLLAAWMTHLPPCPWSTQYILSGA